MKKQFFKLLQEIDNNRLPLKDRRVQNSNKPQRFSNFDNEINTLQQELQGMCVNATYGEDDYNRRVFLGENHPRVREIGERLHEIGGEPLMVHIANSVNRVDQRELDYAWSGIGGWLA